METESVILICGIPDEADNTVIGLFRSYIKGPYESCELLFSGPESNKSFGFSKATPSFTFNKNYLSKTEKQKQVKSFELSLTQNERLLLLKQCEHAISKYRYSDKAAIETVLPDKPFLPFLSWILGKIEVYIKEDKTDNNEYELHCCPTMVASLLDVATKQRFSKGFKDFSAWKVTTTDVVKLCVDNLDAKVIQKMDTYKKVEKIETTTEKNKKRNRNNPPTQTVKVPNVTFFSPV